MNARAHCLLAAVLAALTATTPRAQTPAADVAQPQLGKPNAAATLGQAWLKELLDLDTAGAAADYARISHDLRASSADRQIAAARAVELRRLGVGTELPPPDLREVPETARERLQQALALPTPAVFTAALAAAQTGEPALQQFLAANGALPQLRPFVAPAPPAADRARGMRGRPPGRTDEPAPRNLERLFGLQILRAELEGRGADAAETRRRVFINWRAEPWSADREAELARVRENLVQWLGERDLPAEDREVLKRLQTALEANAKDAAAATTLLDKLPFVADRLRKGR